MGLTKAERAEREEGLRQWQAANMRLRREGLEIRGRLHQQTTPITAATRGDRDTAWAILREPFQFWTRGVGGYTSVPRSLETEFYSAVERVGVETAVAVLLERTEYSARWIASLFAWTPGRVASVQRRHSINRRSTKARDRRKPTAVQLNVTRLEAHRLIHSGLSYRQAGVQLSRSAASVHADLTNHPCPDCSPD